MSSPALVNVRSLSKHYGKKQVLSAVSLELFPGDIYALVGANGAGKTTLLRIIMGLDRPDAGLVTVLSRRMSLFETEVKKRIGYVPDNPNGFEYVTGREFLMYTGALRGIPQKILEPKITELLRIFPLAETASEYMGGYSRGNRQKLAILAALIADPLVLVIDEPIVGLDPSGITILGKLLVKQAQAGRAVLFVTHILDFARKYASRVGYMEHGRLTREIAPKDLEKLDPSFLGGV